MVIFPPSATHKDQINRKQIEEFCNMNSDLPQTGKKRGGREEETFVI